MPLERITADPEVMAGVPCIRGTRIPDESLASRVAALLADAGTMPST